MIHEIRAKSILSKHAKIDSWFMTHYGMNLYRGCHHNCVYCDGRSEKYRVPGEYGRDVYVKINAIDLLEKELDPARKRRPMAKSFMTIGGGVCDAYQPAEAEYQLARHALELCLKYRHPVHILTKSVLVERDLDVLKKINAQGKALVSFSFSSADDRLSRQLEPNVPGPSERLAVMKKLKTAGIACGMFLMPVVPFLTDLPEVMEQTLCKGKEAGVDFVLFGGMTLKSGRQKDYFMAFLKKYYAHLLVEYETIYNKADPWGSLRPDYYRAVLSLFHLLARKHKLPQRMPPRVYRTVIDKNDFIIVVLEHLDYFHRLHHSKSPYGFAARALSKIKEPMDTLSREQLLKVKGVGPVVVKIVREIIRNGNCRDYERLMN
jgi:DNA repair photolyase